MFSQVSVHKGWDGVSIYGTRSLQGGGVMSSGVGEEVCPGGRGMSREGVGLSGVGVGMLGGEGWCVHGGMSGRVGMNVQGRGGHVGGTEACMGSHRSSRGSSYIRSASGRYASYWNAFLFLQLEHYLHQDQILDQC